MVSHGYDTDNQLIMTNNDHVWGSSMMLKMMLKPQQLVKDGFMTCRSAPWLHGRRYGVFHGALPWLQVASWFSQALRNFGFDLTVFFMARMPAPWDSPWEWWWYPSGGDISIELGEWSDECGLNASFCWWLFGYIVSSMWLVIWLSL